MEKQLDLEKNLQELCREYPELIGILAEVGLGDFVKESALKTISRMMTITKGAWIKNLDMMRITAALRGRGFSLTGSAMTDLGLDLTGDDILEADPLTEWDPAAGKTFSWGIEEEKTEEKKEEEAETAKGTESSEESSSADDFSDKASPCKGASVSAGQTRRIETGSFRSLSLEQLEAVLSVLPVELTFFDAAGEKIYCNRCRREDTPSCKNASGHYPSGAAASNPLQERTEEETGLSIREDFLTGKSDSADVWPAEDGDSVLCRYLAVRDEQGTCIGMLRWRQDLEFARRHFQ